MIIRPFTVFGRRSFYTHSSKKQGGHARCRNRKRSKQQQLEIRAAYYEKGDRRKRAHRLITRGAAVESVAPLAKVLSETEFYAFAEKAFALPEVKGLLMEAVNEHNKTEFGGD